MAVTYLGCKRDAKGFERLLVIKRLHPHLAKDEATHMLLEEEATLAAAIRHPNVVHVEDVLRVDGETCLVMPYVESLSLAALLDRLRGAGLRMPPAVAARILLMCLRASMRPTGP